MRGVVVAGPGDDLASVIVRYAVALLSSGLLTALLLRRLARAELRASEERQARAVAEAELVKARDELAARADEQRLLRAAKVVPERKSDPAGRRSSSGTITGSRLAALRARLRDRRRGRD